LKSKRAQIELSHHRRERLFLKLALGSLLGLILLIAIIWGGHGAYVRWQERRLLRSATFAMEHGDDRSASLAARSVLDIKPSSAGAARIMAQITERAGDRIALDWRRKAAELQPHSVEDALAWARCALQFHDTATAERVLSRVDEPAKQTASYHAVAALLAQARQQEENADREWSEAVRLAPTEKAYQLQLGLLRLHAREADRHADGEEILRALRQDPVQRSPATRALISDGIARRQNARELLQLARELQEYPEAKLSDRLLFLDILHQLEDPEFSSYLSTLEKNCATNPVDLGALLSWMSQNNLNLLALDYVKSLPPADLEKWPMPLAMAEIYARLKDWRKLESLTKSANWRQFEFLRHAFLTRALRAQDKPAAAEHEWAAAVKAASAQSDSTLILVGKVSEWGWDSEAVELLWALAKYPEKQREAFQTLYRYYTKTGDSQGLYRVLVRLSELDSGNLDVQNNLAQISLLLNAKPDEARRIAADVYHKMPSNPAYATTYAYALLSKGDAKRAGQVMNSMTEQQLRDPAISAYYGICLAALKDDRARDFLELGRKATLLPEEKALVDKALASVDAGQKAP
jgi:predicted Zn-dependent protease